MHNHTPNSHSHAEYTIPCPPEHSVWRLQLPTRIRSPCGRSKRSRGPDNVNDHVKRNTPPSVHCKLTRCCFPVHTFRWYVAQGPCFARKANPLTLTQGTLYLVLLSIQFGACSHQCGYGPRVAFRSCLHHRSTVLQAKATTAANNQSTANFITNPGNIHPSRQARLQHS